MKTFNLDRLVREKGSVPALLVHQGYYNSSRCYFNPGECHVQIENNNLAGGYVGNTLLVPFRPDKMSKSNVLIELDGLLFLNCILIVNIGNSLYTLKKRHNYLRIKGTKIKAVKEQKLNPLIINKKA